MAEYERTDDGRTVVVRRPNTMGWLAALLLVVVLVVAAFAFGLIKIDQTRDAVLPKVSVDGGQAPKFAVDTAKVDVGSEKKAIEVPKVSVDTEKTAITLPTVDVQRADDPNKKN